MKISFSFFMLLFISFCATAQQQETIDPITRKFYVGINYNTTPYYLKYKAAQPMERNEGINLTATAYPTVNFGYILGERATIQIGASYASNKTYTTAQNRGLIIPVTFRLNFLDINHLLGIKKRLQVFGTSSLTTVFGKSTLKDTTTVNGVVINNDKINRSAVNVFLVLGLGLNYQINDRFSAFGEYIMFKKNLNYNFPSPGKHNFNVGLNYKL